MSHPLASFKYCPRCGSDKFCENNFKSKKCDNCGFVYYFNSSAAVAAFIVDQQGRLLVARRAHEPAKGTFDLPGGFVDLDETAEEAVKREVFEETRLMVNEVKYLFSLPNIYTYSNFDVHTVDMFFGLQVDDFSNIHAADDVSDLFFLKKEELKPELFGLNSIQKAVRLWLSDSFAEIKN